MRIDLLLQRLKDVKGLSITETKDQKNGRTVHTISAVLPEIPFGPNRHAWYPLVLDPGQEIVPRAEIDAMLRHLYHLNSLDLDQPLSVRVAGAGDG